MIFPFNASEVFKIVLLIEDSDRFFYETVATKSFPVDIAKLFKGLIQEEKACEVIFSHGLKGLPASAAATIVCVPYN